MNKLFERFKKQQTPQEGRKPRVGAIIFWVIALVLAAVTFSASRSLFRCWEITNLPGISPSTCSNATNSVLGTPVVNEQGTPVAVAPPTPVFVPEVEMPVWDGASRINILFIGLDYRDYIANEGPPRTDTMILFTVDPQSKTAGMLSIPRDLWVNIPGFGYSRINTAYPSGEGAQLPGGGPGLAMKTVEQVIGVPVQYYGSIDFHAFEEAIDSMGGLYICIKEKIRIDPIGDKKPEVLKPGEEVPLPPHWGVEAPATSSSTQQCSKQVQDEGPKGTVHPAGCVRVRLLFVLFITVSHAACTCNT